jgi:ribonuclease R
VSPVPDSEILRHIRRQPKGTAGFKQLVRELGVRGTDRRDLAESLERLAAGGALTRVDSDRFAIPKTATNQLVGRLSMHRDGYGFVIPNRADLKEPLRTQLSGDVFIAPHQVGSSMHGDRVLVEVSSVRFDGRAEGRILRTVDRAHATVVGTFHYGRRHNYVTPMDEKITQEIIIAEGQEYPPGLPEPGLVEPDLSEEDGAEEDEAKSQAANRDATPHRVLGQEAARRTEWDDLEGVVVDLEITDWPSPTQNPRGRVVEILGYADDFGVDVEIMIRKHHLPHRFPAGVLEEAQSASEIISAHELRHRRDYRDLPVVTIDGETARDFDDAVLVRILENGNYELQVHIADVAHYVTPGSRLDQEARLRGTSVYFPDRAVPMLPLELSTNICSLRPHVERLVLSCIMEIDHQGEIVGYELNQGVIRSAERMTYNEVNAVIEGDTAARQRYAELAVGFDRMKELALGLNRKRQRRGSIDFDLPEPVIEFDDQGLMRGVTRSARNIAHRLIEEFMLSANECVAQYLEARVPSLYRIHEKPDAKRVYEFEVIAATWGYSLGVGSLPIRRVQLKGDRRATQGSGRRPREIEIPQEVKVTPRMYQKLTEKIAGTPEERILSYLMLRSLKQARYAEVNEGHFALAAQSYTHFTSPIRRYPDLIIHRLLKAVLRDSPEERAGEINIGRAGVTREKGQTSSFGWRKVSGPRADKENPREKGAKTTPHAEVFVGPIPVEELRDIAEESSQTERRADEAERELMEWKKVKFMQDRVGEDFDGLIISVTKFGFFVELSDMFIEGLVPLSTLTHDRFTFHENTRQIIGQHSRKVYGLGNKVRVFVDRIDPVLRKIQFAVVEEEPVRKAKRRRK